MIVQKHAVADGSVRLHQGHTATAQDAEVGTVRTVSDGEAVKHRAVRVRAKEVDDGLRKPCAVENGGGRSRRRTQGDAPVDADVLLTNARTNHDGRADRGREDRRLNRRKSASTNHQLARAIVRPTIGVDVARGTAGDVAGVRLAVAVAVGRVARRDVARVRNAVAVAIGLRARGDLARVKNAVVVAIRRRWQSRVVEFDAHAAVGTSSTVHRAKRGHAHGQRTIGHHRVERGQTVAQHRRVRRRRTIDSVGQEVHRPGATFDAHDHPIVRRAQIRRRLNGDLRLRAVSAQQTRECLLRKHRTSQRQQI